MALFKLLHLGSSRKATGGFEIKKGGHRTVLRSRHRFEVVTWSALLGQKRRRDMDMMSRHGWQCGKSRHGLLLSRPGKPIAGRNDVAT